MKAIVHMPAPEPPRPKGITLELTPQEFHDLCVMVRQANSEAEAKPLVREITFARYVLEKELNQLEEAHVWPKP